jgi:phage terminase large subunit-like protein
VRDTLIAGEALALDTVVPTPTGFTTMGDLAAGDLVIAPDGSPTPVTDAFPVLLGRPCFDIEFTNGFHVTADAGHKWATRTLHEQESRSEPVVRTTYDIWQTQTRSGHPNHAIALAQPWDLPEQALPIPPYTLGVWLANGDGASGLITTANPEVLDHIHTEGFESTQSPALERSSIKDRAVCRRIAGLSSALRAAGLRNNKHIPDVYMRASVDQRLALLQGLLDGGGHVSSNSRLAQFSNTNRDLVVACRDLAASLGYRTHAEVSRRDLREDKDKDKDKDKEHWLPVYETWFPMAKGLPNPFRVSKKKRVRTGVKRSTGQWWRIRSITPTRSVPVRCVRVAHPSHQFLITKAGIPTHNSGILAVHPPSETPLWEPSKRLLTWPNGSKALAISADDPNLLRGPQAAWALCDEIATWEHKPDSSGLTAWNNTLIATRLGRNPQIVALTTPKNTPFMRDIMAQIAERDKWILRKGTTFDNAGNLSEVYLSEILGMYEGTSLARQELYGEMFDGDLEGTLFSPSDIDPNRLDAAPDSPLAFVVGVDPSVAERPRDECGIIVVAATMERNAPSQWARAASETARRFSAPIVVEVNQGGALVRDAISSTDPSVRVLEVRATESKRTRAEPVALLYEQGRVHHIGEFPQLEEQMLLWQPEHTKRSPDRVDALVWAITALTTGTRKGSLITPRMRASARASRTRLPAVSASNGLAIRSRFGPRSR